MFDMKRTRKELGIHTTDKQHILHERKLFYANCQNTVKHSTLNRNHFGPFQFVFYAKVYLTTFVPRWRRQSFPLQGQEVDVGFSPDVASVIVAHHLDLSPPEDDLQVHGSLPVPRGVWHLHD